MRRKKKDIYRILMLPLMTMFLLNIGLVATTWAWYTASISTGVNSITAGVDVSETVSCGNGCTVNGENGVYVLGSEVNTETTYTVSFKSGKASNGYIALIDISENKTANTVSLLDLFGTRVYAEEQSNITNEFKGYIELPQANSNTSIKITVDSEKLLTIKYIWKVVENNQIIFGEDYQVYSEQSLSNDSEINIKQNQETQAATVTFNYVDANGKPLPYSVFGIETYGLKESEEQPQNATIVYDADSEEYEIYAPDGYLLQKDESRGETEDQESRVYSVEPGVETVIDVYCVETADSTGDQPYEEPTTPQEPQKEEDNLTEKEYDATSTTESEINPIPSSGNLVVDEQENIEADVTGEEDDTLGEGTGEEDTSPEESTEVNCDAQSE